MNRLLTLVGVGVLMLMGLPTSEPTQFRGHRGTHKQGPKPVPFPKWPKPRFPRYPA